MLSGEIVERAGAALTREATVGELSPWHLLIVAAVFMLLFGANKLPQMARSVGQSMRIFKAETRALSGEKEPEQLPQTPSSSAAAPSLQHQSQPHQNPQAHNPDPHQDSQPHQPTPPAQSVQPPSV
ncbi:MAG: Sec-independent protein translocase subunit TatA [Pseudonocardiaceae bacterium]